MLKLDGNKTLAALKAALVAEAKTAAAAKPKAVLPKLTRPSAEPVEVECYGCKGRTFALPFVLVHTCPACKEHIQMAKALRFPVPTVFVKTAEEPSRAAAYSNWKRSINRVR